MMLFLRVAVLFLLALAFWNPEWFGEGGPSDCFVLLDDSYSMQGKLDRQTWGYVQAKLRTLPEGSRVALIRYAKQPVLEMPLTPIDDPGLATLLNSTLPPKLEVLDRSATNLEKALIFAARQMRPKRAITVIVVHDDQQTLGDASPMIRQFQRQGYQLYQINLATEHPAPDAWIQALKAPLYGKPEQSIPAGVVVQGNRDMDMVLNLYINDSLQRRQSISIVSGQPTALHFELAACHAEVCRIKAQLETENDTISENNQRQVAVTIDKAKPVLYIRHQNAPMLTTLTNVGVAVNAIGPESCVGALDQLNAYAAVILDDIGIAMMSDRCWQGLAQAVNNIGVGLIVLGGPNSFAAGSYRHSVLEELLPVTAEASSQSQANTLLFVIDKSGSMDTDSTGKNNIAISRQAAIESVAAQGAQDDFGLISFDTQPHLLIPIKHYDDSVAVIKAAFNPQAKGGTRLKPAIDFALQELHKVETPSRTMVLITDGFLDDQDLDAVERKIIEEKVSLIALAIGNDADAEKLRRLTEHNNGRLLRVDRVVELPVLLRQELDQRRNPVMTGRVSVNQDISVPFMSQNMAWPDISGYMVTKTKPDSVAFLNSDHRDPLLAMRYAGVGKVVAVPAGLGIWTENWLHWPHWHRFVQGLVSWVSQSAAQQQLNIRLSKTADEAQLVVDVITPDFAWQSNLTGVIHVTDPKNYSQSIPLNMIAPGQYIAELPMRLQGGYSIGVRIGDANTALHIFSDAIDEYLPTAAANSPALSKLVADGRKIETIKSVRVVEVRNAFLVGALAFYLTLILLANKRITHVTFSWFLLTFRGFRWLRIKY
ncbi:MAG: VWA domain-containing protein [Gammaproteobacteria bacterium]